MQEKDYTQKLDKVIKIDETQIKDHLGEMVRGTVEDTLNKMLDAEADSVGLGNWCWHYLLSP